MTKKESVLTVAVSPEMKTELFEVAKTIHITPSEIVRWAIIEKIREIKR